MRWSEIGEQACPVAKSLSVLGDRWTMLVLREAFWRVRRFEDFQARTGAPRPVLAERLDRLPLLAAHAQAHLAAAGIETLVHYPVPIPRQPALAAETPTDCPEGNRACDEVLSLPLHPGLEMTDVEAVVASVCAFHEE